MRILPFGDRALLVEVAPDDARPGEAVLRGARVGETVLREPGSGEAARPAVVTGKAVLREPGSDEAARPAVRPSEAAPDVPGRPGVLPAVVPDEAAPPGVRPSDVAPDVPGPGGGRPPRDARPGATDATRLPIAQVLALHARLEASRPRGVVDLVPAARTVLVRVDPAVLQLSAARAWVEAAAAEQTAVPARPAREVALDVVYDGPDLIGVAALLGIDADTLVRRHTATTWTVAFTGFAPGFGYLVGDDWPYDVPRLRSPRTRVPAGAVGLAGAFSGAYPRPTPGGWQLIGTTDAVLFDADAADPVLLVPGTRVRFRATGAAPAAPLAAPASATPTPAAARAIPAKVLLTDESAGTTRSFVRQKHSRRPDGAAEPPRNVAAAFEVREPGLSATVQDLGRPGRAAEGIAASGALDRGALRAANRIVGNREDAAGIEITMGGFCAVAERDLWIAVTGGWGPIRIDGHDVDPWQPVRWPVGAVLHIDWLTHGARAYLAVRGGVAVGEVAGSCATDTLAGLGPDPLHAGRRLATGHAASGPVPPAEPVMAAAPGDDLEIALAPGPRADRFTDAARAALFEAVWTVTDHADRVGIRLDGPVLDRVETAELASEGMVPGALQVPPDGRPVILMADGPVTGGYPVIAVATDAALDALAQARPGCRIRFRHARPPH
ncbi:urea amidolyase family protein [Microbacterium luticocti]|uniref:5-oxoprolinase subunit B/C family protein n=1 Tax=Microbacterium luticocti TaxID=451764 RepID=UPI0009FBCC81|nr:urea amidolyase family protein [Microbacterium luticocti]